MAISLSSSFKTCILSLTPLLLPLLPPHYPNFRCPKLPLPGSHNPPHRSLITTAAKTPPCSSTGDCEMQRGLVVPDARIGHVSESSEDGKRSFRFRRALGMISKAWEFPVSFLLKLTIPQAAPSEWSRFYSSANIALCPLALLYACNSFIPFHHPVVFLLSDTHLPLWFVILLATSSLSLLHYAVEKEPPKTEQLPILLIAFVMSVFWISTTVGELLNCLAALGTLLALPPALLGLTVLAWGNSVGDLVADVAIAKAGHPAMAMAGCFAGPMFNMLVGFGTPLVIQTYDVYPEVYDFSSTWV